jgi:hypothetical protein
LFCEDCVDEDAEEQVEDDVEYDDDDEDDEEEVYCEDCGDQIFSFSCVDCGQVYPSDEMNEEYERDGHGSYKCYYYCNDCYEFRHQDE